MIRISEKINDNFKPFWRACNSNKYLYHVLKGGRGSAKSTHIAFKIIMDMMKYPITTLCVRKVGNTLAESVFEQLKEAIEMLGVTSYWKIQKSPLQLIYIPTGNKIIFRGADDPSKIKSIKISKYPLTYLWIEELAEFKTEDEVSMIVNSVLRAELPDNLNYKVFFSYNPPKRKQSWVNKKYETQFLNDNVYLHHSTYLENPYISKAFKEEAQSIKEKNGFKYRWEYLGEPIGSGVVPFSNLIFRSITDSEIKAFDNIRQGCDFGYATDPCALIRCHFDKTRRTLYIFDEIYQVKLSNRNLCEIMKNKKIDDVSTVFDSAEPKSIAEIRTYGVKAEPARKGQGSVEYGEKWLDDLDAIIIDHKRVPHTAKEFENIDYETDRDGNPKAKLEDKDNHSIDATRYACEKFMKHVSGAAVFK